MTFYKTLFSISLVAFLCSTQAMATSKDLAEDPIISSPDNLGFKGFKAPHPLLRRQNAVTLETPSPQTPSPRKLTRQKAVFGPEWLAQQTAVSEESPFAPTKRPPACKRKRKNKGETDRKRRYSQVAFVVAEGAENTQNQADTRKATSKTCKKTKRGPVFPKDEDLTPEVTTIKNTPDETCPSQVFPEASPLQRTFSICWGSPSTHTDQTWTEAESKVFLGDFRALKKEEVFEILLKHRRQMVFGHKK